MPTPDQIAVLQPSFRNHKMRMQ
uniref:Uncharacterized protein n=1 Tax=Anguilla anguilla TaxID=7936 RepID=A0A0E9V3K1_ANGAN